MHQHQPCKEACYDRKLPGREYAMVKIEYRELDEDDGRAVNDDTGHITLKPESVRAKTTHLDF